jgi:hypothetical protein
VSTRNQHDRSLSPAYQEYLRDKQAEDDAAKAAADAAAAAEIARVTQTPEALYKAAINTVFQSEQEQVRTGVINEVYLAQFGEFQKGTCSESDAIATRILFRTTTSDFIRNNTNGATLVAMVQRNGLLESDIRSYQICHEICKTWGLYVDADPEPMVEQPVVEPEPVVEQEVLTPSQQYMANRASKDVVIGIADGVEITERMLEAMPSKDELRIRRVLEKGHSGSAAFDEYLNVRDAQFERDKEINRIAREEGR